MVRKELNSPRIDVFLLCVVVERTQVHESSSLMVVSLPLDKQQGREKNTPKVDDILHIMMTMIKGVKKRNEISPLSS